jgi:hypothetical protein
MFYGPTDALNLTYVRPQGWETNIGLINSSSAYIYFGTNAAETGILLKERPDIWKENSNSWQFSKIYVLMTNFSLELRPKGK